MIGKEPFLPRLAGSFRRLDRLSKIILIAFVLAGAASATLAFSFARQLVESTTSFQLPGIALPQTDGDPAQEGAAPAPAAQSSRVKPEPWDGTSRVNILVMGLDYRDWAAGEGPPRTDTMIVLTYDPATNTAGMLSVPRDLWVDIPGFGHDKINTAYFLGEGAQLPGGGAGLAVKTVEQFLGITINYYAQIDFHAFERFIDTIGGVKIDVPSTIRVQLIGEDRTRLIQDGRRTLNGAYALAYARARKEGDGDFDRARRQQQLILGLRTQLLREDVRALLLTRGFEIYQELSSGINTNMSIGEIFSLGWAVKDINPENIAQAVIAPPEYVTLGTSPDGLSILKPISEQIRVLRDQVFSSGSVRSAVASNTEAGQLMQMEAAAVVINNGSGEAGLADSTRAFLEGQGIKIASTGNADLVGATTIIDYTGNPYTVQFLASLMGVNNTHIYSRFDPNSAVDVEVIVGPDWVVP